MNVRTVAVLYADPLGPYVSMPGVDPWFVDGISDHPRFAWPEQFHAHRDARLYDGPHPIVAHPPCGPWGSLRHLSFGDGVDCAPRALEQVRQWGGCLEHPDRSRLWSTFGVPLPSELPDSFGGWTIDVEQVSWGHVARKRTRLYFVGIDRALVERTLRTGGEPTHWCSGRRQPRKGGGSVPLGIKVCSAAQRRRTPPLFAEWLVALARSVKKGTKP